MIYYGFMEASSRGQLLPSSRVAYVACKALASIPNAPPLFRRCLTAGALLWINRVEYGVHARVLRAEYGPRGDAVGFCGILVPLRLLAKTPVVIQRGLCALIIAAARVARAGLCGSQPASLRHRAGVASMA